MTYQRFSGARASAVDSVVIIRPALGPLRQQADRALEDRVQHGDVEPDDKADREDEHGQVAGLLPRRPGDLLQLRPRFVDEASNASHLSCLPSACSTTRSHPPKAEAAV